jgi:hypothetical protein
MSAYSRAEKLMDTWAQRGLISEEGKAYLTVALDPFHDSQIEKLVGYPDIEVSPSLVRMVKKSITVTKPAGLPAGDWNCQVIQWPWMKQMPFRESTTRQNNQIFGDAPVQNLGGLQILCCGSADPGQFDINNAAMIRFGALELEDEILQGSNRLLSAGYEVHNTTAEIYKQGAVCNYMMHNVPKDASLFTRNQAVAPFAILQAFNGTSFRTIPRDTAQALLIPGSNEWGAEDGVYSVARFAGVDNPPFTVDYNLPVLFEVDDLPSNDTTTYPNTSQVVFPANAMSGTVSSVPAWKSFPIHTNGSILTGLSENTSLRINWNVVIESFPGPRDVKDLSIATPSASFDPRALEIYSHTLGSAPVAVPVGENPLGEWFMDMVGKVGNFLGNVPGPVGLIGKGVGVIADSMKGYMTTPSGNQVSTTPKKAVVPKATRATQPTRKTIKTFGQRDWQALTPAQRKKLKNEYDIKIVEAPKLPPRK